MTTNFQLQDALGDVPDFIGVFAANELPARDSVHAQRPYSLIVNYDRSGLPGVHWVGMRFPARGPAQYFDSFGIDADQADRIVHVGTHFKTYLKKQSETGTYFHNTFDFQCLEDDTCGEWAALFIRHGLPMFNPGFWRPLMDMRSCAARDLAARREAAVLPPSERHLEREDSHTTLTPTELRRLVRDGGRAM
jgi:hypothetical protein